MEKQRGLAIAVHPGIVRTNLMKNAFEGIYIYIHRFILYPMSLVISISAWEGAQTILYSIYTEPNKLNSGGYYANCGQAKTNDLVDLHYKQIVEDT